ncbi:hypothetical protein AALO_G00143640 [Alosa alosa]|uniref:Uncharacterized protein n=1 Tax=Alosa alosa TaxID=278164 RepID=A0AAV6GIP7_9TELE|nr:uncharacterized protein LOC125301907 [Alosa alosa]KAG5275108.1 hypothetical protein AALO_G00143640 [Alosa alosa]
MDATPQAPQVKKVKVAPQGHHQKSNDLKQRLEIATMLLQLAQDVPALIPEARCTINLQKELLLIQECSSKGNKSTFGPKKGTSVKACARQGTGSNTKGCSKTQKPCSTGKYGQKRKHLSSLDSGPVVGPEWTAARDKEDMFFPHLEDSSLMAEAKERKRREMAQESSLRQMAEPVEESYIKNAAVLPDLRPLPPLAPSSAQSSSLLSAALSEPLLTHGHTAEDYQAIYHSVEDYQAIYHSAEDYQAIYHSVEDYQAIYHSAEDYQAIYHSVVDPMLKTKSGNARQYNLGMGRAIKQRLLEKMSCPTLVETVDSDGRVHITKSFSAPTLKSYAPQIGVGISGEALPGQPKRKRARH